MTEAEFEKIVDEVVEKMKRVPREYRPLSPQDLMEIMIKRKDKECSKEFLEWVCGGNKDGT